MHVERTGKVSGLGEPLLHLVLHGVPDLPQEIPDFGTFAEFDVFGKSDVSERAELLDLGKGILHVDILFTVALPVR